MSGKDRRRGALEGRRRMWRITAIVVAVLIVVAAGATVAVTRFHVVDRLTGTSEASASVPLIDPDPQIRPVPPNAPMPLPQSLAQQLAPAVGNPALGTFAGVVTDAETGKVLWEKDPYRPMTPGSTAKVLTVAAAMLTLPLDSRLTTTVVQGAAPGQLVLVGAGDPTLTAQPPGVPGFYRDGPRISDLVTQIKKAGTPVTSVAVDTGLYPGPRMAEGWLTSDIAGGNIAPIEPVMLDGGRINPQQDESPRSATPALDAGRALATGLGLDPAQVTKVTAPAGATPVASVQSAPLSERLHELMIVSDNVLAQTVGMQVARARGQAMTFDGAVTAVKDALRQAGFDTAGLTLKDSNGLSTGDRIPPRLLSQVLTAAAGSGHPKLRPLLDDLPVAAATGTLSDRFDGPSHVAAGWLRAKTGTLSGASTLAGVVTDDDNRVLTFALMAGDTPPNVARPGLDAVAAVLRGCGCR